MIAEGRGFATVIFNRDYRPVTGRPTMGGRKHGCMLC